MDDQGETGRNRGRKVARPLDQARLDEMALGYVARFATSSGRLGDYLKRKIRERGWEGAGTPDVPALVERMVARGYVDDAGFALARGAGLMRRGFGARRIAQTLGRDGIDAPLVAQASGSERERRAAALAFAQRRRLGPFGTGSHENGDKRQGRIDPATRARQVAAMVRAGHPFAAASAMIDAADSDAAQEWVDEADDS
ncbi:regulatory protein RecX [Novosphingobium acidiphilum]|uniref:regulatory protein RecX n=1 Tax=Novosphingobium acidiphilum TaxID=505248 RepID=UPI00048CA904|nr:RecX family transcriptional regulator [Novosphingobium acidiphilum]